MLVLVVLVAAQSCGGPVLYVEHTEACALFHRIENSCYRGRCNVSV